ncbi:MAG TPA: TonB-dependent receptor [Bryobacteraceae bacterium]|nr:TonB-dependent receptor [Bryobacteraceae bacterium]
MSYPHFRIVLALALAASLTGQSERGNVSGTVTDPGGAAVAGAKLTLVHVDTNTTLTSATSEAGEFNIPNLSPGSYRLDVTAPGFKHQVQDKIIVAAASGTRVDVQMQLGQVTETIEVSAAAVLIQSENAKVSTQVQNKLVDELPLVVGGEMRSPFNLVAVAAEARGSGGRMSLGGGQAAAWDATLDGHSVGTNRSSDTAEAALNTPSVEALTEFTVDTNGFKAEYGQAGGGVMTFASKSGTNQFHGSAYDFLRNDAMDARGFFAQRRSVYRQNDFGFTASGPVIVPKLYNGRNRSFFFVSYEGFRNRVGANDSIFSVPTPEMYNGDFRNWVDQNGRMIPIYDPATTRPNPNGSGFIRDPFPNNVIPPQRFSSFTRTILPYAQGLAPNRGAAPGTSAYVRQNYIVTGGTEVTPTDKWSVKGDQNIGDKQRLSFLWNMTTFRRKPGAAGPPGLPDPLWSGQIQAWDTEAYRITHDYTLTSSLVNHFSWFRNSFRKDSFSGATGRDWKDKVCMKGVVDCNVNFPSIRFTEFAQWNSTAYNGTEQPGWSVKEDLSWIRGSHTMKFGFSFHDQNANGFGQQDISGRADFSFLSTSIPGSTSFPASGGSSFASFLLGDAFFGRTETVRAVNQNFPYYGFYAQDDWRITRKLTLNIGLRYEFTLPPRSDLDEYSDFDPDRPNPDADGHPGALMFAGFGPGREGRRSLVPGWYGGWGPRIGLAYAPDNRTTFRTAFGRSFSRVTAVQGSGHFAGFIGQYEFNNADQGLTPTFNWDQGLPAYGLPPSIDPAFSNGNTVDWWQGQEATRAPESLYWTFSIQREAVRNTVVEIAYNANIGTHLQTGLLNYNQVPTRYLDQFVQQYGPTQALALLRADIDSPQARAANIPIPYPSFTTQRLRTVAQALRPFPQYQNIVTGVQNGDKSGHSSYHAMVLKLDRRFSQGLTMNWNYTLSKLLTDSDTYFANGAAAQDHYNRRLEKSIGQNDQTHVLKFSTLYELPFGRGRRWLQGGFLSHVIGGWRLSAIQIYASGMPIALSRNNPLPISNGVTRPVIDSYDDWRAPIKGDKFDPAVDRFLKPASEFPSQPAHMFGNATRYNPKVRGFWSKDESVSVAKTFPLTESVRIDLRGEAFNLLNRTIFGTGNTNLNSNDFGIVASQVNNPRQLQVALKIYW